MSGVEETLDQELWPSVARGTGGPNVGAKQLAAELVAAGLDPYPLVQSIASRIFNDLAPESSMQPEQPWSFVVVMDGGLFFATDLIRGLEESREQSYRGSSESRPRMVTEQSGLCLIRAYHYKGAFKPNSNGAHIQATSGQVLTPRVLLIDDICDTGKTLEWVKQYLQTSNWPSIRPEVIKTVALLKREGSAFKPDYWGLEIPKGLWALGYGMNDDDQSWRCTRHISFALS